MIRCCRARRAPADADVSSYFEAMSAMLNRGWAPLQGVVAGQEKYIDLPKPELYDLAADPHGANEPRRSPIRPPTRARGTAAGPPCGTAWRAVRPSRRRSPRNSSSLGYTSGSAPQKANYTEDDDPKNLMELDQWIQQGIEAWQHGRRDEATAIYERIIQRRPTMAIGYRNLAFLQWQNGDARGAIHDAGARFPCGCHRAWHDDTAGLLPGRSGTACRRYRAARAARPAQTPADPDALNALGIALCASAARTSVRRPSSSAPSTRTRSNVQALENIGTLEMQRGNPAAAERGTRAARSDRSEIRERTQRTRRAWR